MKAALIFIKLTMLLFITTSNTTVAQGGSVKQRYMRVKKLERKNETLFKHIKTIEQTLLAKDWDTLITFCISENYEVQQEAGTEQLQYIYELLNVVAATGFQTGLNYQEHINYVLNNLKSFNIKKYKLTQKGMLGNNYYFFGKMILINGTVLLFEYELMELNNSFKLIRSIG